jgi:hypothetical protein
MKISGLPKSFYLKVGFPIAWQCNNCKRMAKFVLVTPDNQLNIQVTAAMAARVKENL